VRERRKIGGLIPTRKRLGRPSLLSLFPEFRPSVFRHAVLERQNGALASLHDAYLHRGLVLYVGAGVSLSLGLPSWPDLIRTLTVRMMSRRVASAIDRLGKSSDEDKWEQLSRLNVEVEKGADSGKPILMMARAVKDDFREQVSAEIARRLYRPVYFRLQRTWESKRRKRQLATPRGRRLARFRREPIPLPTSELLDAIVSLARAQRDVRGLQAIVNYNFDDLLDEKLREQQVKCRTVLSGQDTPPAGTLPCFHVHGLIPSREYVRDPLRVRAKGNFVFSEDEYHAEYADPYRWSNMTQMSLLARYIGLFVGLSMEDPNIRRLIDVTHRQFPDNTNYAILPRKVGLRRSKDSSESVLRNLFEEVETKSFSNIGVQRSLPCRRARKHLLEAW
jgi:hypothetical protein